MTSHIFDDRYEDTHELFCLKRTVISFILKTILKKKHFITPPARRAWRSYKFGGFCFFLGCRKLGYRSWVILLCILLSEPASPWLLNSISSKLCHQNTQFNMYTTISKQQEGVKTRIQTVL